MAADDERRLDEMRSALDALSSRLHDVPRGHALPLGLRLSLAELAAAAGPTVLRSPSRGR